MSTKIESFARDSEERRLEETVKTLTPEEAKRFLEQEATLYLDMVYGYTSAERLRKKR